MAIFTLFPRAFATFSKVESFTSSEWFSILEITLFVVLIRRANSS